MAFTAICWVLTISCMIRAHFYWKKTLRSRTRATRLSATMDAAAVVAAHRTRLLLEGRHREGALLLAIETDIFEANDTLMRQEEPWATTSS